MILKIFFLILSVMSLSASGLALNSDSIGSGGVDIAMGDSPNSIFSNPSNLNTLINRGTLTIEPIEFSIALNRDTLNFLSELSSDFDNAKKVSELMKKNIGKTLSFRTNNFTSVYRDYNNYSWLLGLHYDISGHFITHSGFGSMGAMESYVEKYRTVVGSLSSSYININYGVNIRAVEKYLTIHNYSVGEIIENDSFVEYFDNRYTKKEGAIAIDMGIDHRFRDVKVALSMLNIGDTTFGDIGSTHLQPIWDCHISIKSFYLVWII